MKTSDIWMLYQLGDKIINSQKVIPTSRVTQNVTLSEKSKVILTAEKEFVKLYAEAENITKQIKDAHHEFRLEMLRLSKHHNAVFNKIAALEELLERV